MASLSAPFVCIDRVELEKFGMKRLELNGDVFSISLGCSKADKHKSSLKYYSLIFSLLCYFQNLKKILVCEGGLYNLKLLCFIFR